MYIVLHSWVNVDGSVPEGRASVDGPFTTLEIAQSKLELIVRSKKNAGSHIVTKISENMYRLHTISDTQDSIGYLQIIGSKSGSL